MNKLKENEKKAHKWNSILLLVCVENVLVSIISRREMNIIIAWKTIQDWNYKPFDIAFLFFHFISNLRYSYLWEQFISFRSKRIWNDMNFFLLDDAKWDILQMNNLFLICYGFNEVYSFTSDSRVFRIVSENVPINFHSFGWFVCCWRKEANWNSFCCCWMDGLQLNCT